MIRHKGNVLLILSLLFIIGGCAIFPKGAPTPLIVDPLVERNREWREQVEIGNTELQRENLRAALTAYETAMAMRPDASEIQRKIAEIYFQLEEYEPHPHIAAPVAV